MAILPSSCPKNDPQHVAHMELNGECPWCDAVGERDKSLDGLTEEEAVEEIVRRHG